MKSCIVYLPYKLDEGLDRARMIRPRKMIRAFKELSYNVIVICGEKRERRRKVQEALKDIEGGINIDFMYMEAYTLPWRLTQTDHIPFFLRQEIVLFEYLKKKGVKIGLFYPDIYWKLPYYGKKLDGNVIKSWKIIMSKLLFQRDIELYKKYLSVFYVPNIKMVNYLMSDKLSEIAEELPPGCENIDIPEHKNNKVIKLIYVGGIDNSNYNMIECVKAVSALKDVEMELCCREKNWKEVRHLYEGSMDKNIYVVHKNMETIRNSYFRADIGLLIFDNIELRQFAAPFKLYEYISYGLPVIATEASFAADFINKNHVGWVVKNNKDEIIKLLTFLVKNRKEVIKAHHNCLKVQKENLWLVRARKVQYDLSGTGDIDGDKI